jgi:hypothetical protein
LRTGALVANTEPAWLDGLEFIYRQGWRQIAKEQRRIIQIRNMDRLTGECWARAIEPVILERPLSGKELKQGLSLSFGEKLVKSHFLKKIKGKLPEPFTRWVKKMILRGS